MRVCYFGTYRSEYARNQILIEGLRRNGVEVIECHETLWHGTDDRVHITLGGWRNPGFWVRAFKAYSRLLWRHRSCEYDVMVVGFPGQFDVFLARILTWLRRKPLVWDVLTSIYLIACERQLDLTSPFTVKALRVLENIACRLPDQLLLNTEEYVAWYGLTYNIPSTRFRLVPMGADDRFFQPRSASPRSDAQFRVIYYGAFIPNHDVLCIVDAARELVREDQIHFFMIGDGPMRGVAEATARSYALANITFTGWMEKKDLTEQVACADLCLGIFGATPQALMTFNNKIFECLAMAKPVITGETPPLRKLFEHGKHLFLTNRSDPQALAEAIIHLKSHPELTKSLASNGYQYYLENFTPTHLGAIMLKHLSELVDRAPNSQ